MDSDIMEVVFHTQPPPWPFSLSGFLALYELTDQPSLSWTWERQPDSPDLERVPLPPKNAYLFHWKPGQTPVQVVDRNSEWGSGIHDQFSLKNNSNSDH
jgi:hypothetical protein